MPDTTALHRAVIFLRAKLLTSCVADCDAFHAYLLGIGADVQAIVEECKARGWISGPHSYIKNRDRRVDGDLDMATVYHLADALKTAITGADGGLPAETPRVAAAPQRSKKKQWTNATAEPVVRKYCKKHPDAGRNKIADDTGVPRPTVSRTKAYKEHVASRRDASTGKKPKHVSLSNVEKVLGEGQRHEVLQELIAQQEADDEPSPLDEQGENPKVELWHN